MSSSPIDPKLNHSQRRERWDDQIVHDVMRNFNWQISEKHHTVKLPCNHGSVELERPEDTYVKCGQCGQQFFIAWSKVASKRKVYGNDAN